MNYEQKHPISQEIYEYLKNTPKEQVDEDWSYVFKETHPTESYYEQKYKEALERAMNLFVTNNISATAVCEIFPELNESEKVNYEKKYKKALEWMQGLYSGLHGATKEEAEHYFPELKESEDERIRKTIIRIFKGEIRYTSKEDIDKYVTWLEKQGEKKPTLPKWKYKKDHIPLLKDSLILNKYGCVGKSPSGAIVSDVWVLDYDELAKLPKEELEKQGKEDYCIGCTNDKGCVTCENGNLKEIKIEQKFKVGDWVVSNNNEEVWQIGARYTEEGQRIYLYNVNDVMMSITLEELNNDYHPWTIADAKDGDVLVSKDNRPFIFTGEFDVQDDNPTAYCGIDSSDKFITGMGSHWTLKNGIKPATKEQSDLLFSKMKEAGYEWDSEKKELKKIEVKPLDADKVIEWLNENVANFWANPCNPNRVVNRFKKDFGL